MLFTLLSGFFPFEMAQKRDQRFEIFHGDTARTTHPPSAPPTHPPSAPPVADCRTWGAPPDRTHTSRPC